MNTQNVKERIAIKSARECDVKRREKKETVEEFFYLYDLLPLTPTYSWLTVLPSLQNNI